MGNESLSNELLENCRLVYDQGSDLLKYAWGFELNLFSGKFDEAIDALENILNPEKDILLWNTRYKIMDVPLPWKWFLVYQSEITKPLANKPRYQRIMNHWESMIAFEKEKIKKLLNQDS